MRGGVFIKKYNVSNFLNLIASLLVVYHHSYAIYFKPGNGKGEIFSSYLKYGSLGALMVTFFFVSSGYFLTLSFSKKKDVADFIYKRIKRIVPSLLIVLLLTVFIIVPLCSDKGFMNEFLIVSREKINYILDNLFLIKNTKYSIGNIFETTSYGRVLNGSIWTIKHQVFTHLLFIVIYKLGLLKKENILLIFIPFLVLALGLQFGYFDQTLYFIKSKLWYIGVVNEINQLVTYSYFFLAGVILYLYKDNIKPNFNGVITMLFLTIVFNQYSLFSTITLLSLPYIYVFLTNGKTNINTTYEIFLCSFPIQQLLMYFQVTDNFLIFICLSILFSVLVAYPISFFSNKLVKLISKKSIKGCLK